MHFYTCRTTVYSFESLSKYRSDALHHWTPPFNHIITSPRYAPPNSAQTTMNTVSISDSDHGIAVETCLTGGGGETKNQHRPQQLKSGLTRFTPSPH